MATVEIVTLTDSLDERIKNGVETVKFFDPMTGNEREIELGEANRKHFANHLEKLQKYIDASREVVAPVAVKPATKNDLTAVREWAKANGFTIGDRGRIKAEILEAYDKAQILTAVEVDKIAEQDVTETREPLDVVSEDSAPISEEEFLKLMDQASQDGEVTLDKLAELAQKS